ncbi:MAG TPA: immunoglobulin domain-containing protein, partial [Anaerohalosphaeraceae bacterium]|nr:immunoglobulin domain-containing protein [Anaerohalosphaeraceae bacterium]
DLIHHWKLDESSLTWNGSTWGDIIDSVPGNPLGLLWGYSETDPITTTVINQPGLPLYPADRAYNFTEQISAISAAFLNNNTAVPASGDFTALVWMKTNQLHSGTNKEGHLFSNNNGQAGRASLYLHNGALRWFHNGGISLADETLDKESLFDDNWHEVGISRKGNQFVLLRDGRVVASGYASGAATFSTNTSWMIGRARSYSGDYDGYVADVKVYNTDYSLISDRAWDPAPANAALDVPTSVALEWNTAMDPNYPSLVNADITKHYLYLVDTEPNFADVSPIVIGAGSPPDASVYYPITLQKDKTYYWRVDESVRDSGVSDPNTIRGFVWSFSTIKSVPVITSQPDDVLLTAVNETAEFVIQVSSITQETYSWYKSADNANNTPNDDIAVGTNSDTLILSNASSSDEGYYYCKVSNSGGAVYSNVVRLAISRTVAHWTLDQDDYVGGQYLDTSGDGRHAIPDGTPSFVTGQLGEGVNIQPQTNGWASAGNWNPSELSDQMSVSFWLKWAGKNGTWQTFVAKRASGAWNNTNVAWQVSTQNNLPVLRLESPNTLIEVVDSLVEGQWQHIVMTFNGTTGRLYINGEIRAAANFICGNALDAPVMIGVANPDGEYPLNGILDDVKIFNYALSDREVAVMYTTDDPTKTVCVPSMRPDAKYDRNGDCKVDLYDFIELAGEWLDCGLFPQSACY